MMHPRLLREGNALEGGAPEGKLPRVVGTRPPRSGNPVNPRVGSSLQHADEPGVAKAVEVVENHEGGTCRIGGTIRPMQASVCGRTRPR